jgi:tripartite-type tricarboxylate transporter receptor subunit TctC
MKEHLASLGAEPVGSTPEQFASYISSEIAKYAKLVKIAGVRVE